MLCSLTGLNETVEGTRLFGVVGISALELEAGCSGTGLGVTGPVGLFGTTSGTYFTGTFSPGLPGTGSTGSPGLPDSGW